MEAIRSSTSAAPNTEAGRFAGVVPLRGAADAPRERLLFPEGPRGCPGSRLRVALHGAIDNAPDLGRELLALGHRLEGTGADVVAHAYEAWGEECLGRLHGSFALSLWDEAERVLLLARDRMGGRPLYYGHSTSSIAFGSHLEPTADLAGVSRGVDPQAVDAYLAIHAVPAPLCIYAGLCKLPAAHALTVRDGEARVRRYWSPMEPPHELSPREAAERFRALFSETVARIVATAPSGRAGVLLSGGPDSGMILAASRSSGAALSTFTFGFTGGHVDTGRARRTAAHYGASHHEHVLDPAVAAILPAVVRRYEEPHGNASALFWHHVRAQAGAHADVLLAGEGADELFGGRDSHLAAAWADAAHRLAPRQLLWACARACALAGRADAEKLLRGTALPRRERAAFFMSTFTSEARALLYAPDFARRLHIDRHYELCVPPVEVAAQPLVHAFAFEVGLWLPEVILCTAGGADGAEVRMPFLDPRIAEAAAAIPPVERVGWLTSKRVLRAVYAADLPPWLDERRRQGGVKIPVAAPLRGELRPYLEDYLLSPTALGRGYFDAGQVRRLVAEHVGGARDHAAKLWELFMLELWHRRAELW